MIYNIHWALVDKSTIVMVSRLLMPCVNNSLRTEDW